MRAQSGEDVQAALIYLSNTIEMQSEPGTAFMDATGYPLNRLSYGLVPDWERMVGDWAKKHLGSRTAIIITDVLGHERGGK